MRAARALAPPPLPRAMSSRRPPEGREQVLVAKEHRIDRMHATEVTQAPLRGIAPCEIVAHEPFDARHGVLGVPGDTRHRLPVLARSGIDKGDVGYAARPALQERIRESLELRRVEEDARAVEVFIDLRVRHESGKVDVRQRRRGALDRAVRAIVPVAGTADDDEAILWEAPRDLQRQLRALATSS